MGWVRKLEEQAAKKLQKIFLDANKYADSAILDLEQAEKALADAQAKAVEATQRAHESAVEAAQKAQQVADALVIEARAAEERAAFIQEQVKK